MKKLSTLIISLIFSGLLHAQFNTFVTVPPLSGGGNTLGGICFNLTTNKTIIVDSLLSSFSTASGTATIWYNPQRINGSPGGINAANGWIQLGQSAPFNGISPSSTQPIPQVVPAPVGVIMQPGDTFGFAIHWTGNVFSTTNTNIPTFTDGTVTIIVDAASAFTFNPAQTSFFNPRQLNGGVMYRLLTTAPNDAGVVSIDSPQVFCPGVHPVKATIANFGSNVINNVTVNWSINNVLQTPVSVTTPLDTFGGSGSQTAQVTLGTFNFLAGTNYTIKVWTSNPNNQADTVNFNDTLTVVRSPSLSGTFTVNATQPTSATNFQSFTDLANALNSSGICGPVVVNVAPYSGPYTEQVTFNEIAGATMTNTITINGNGNTIQFAPISAARHIIMLDGTDYMTIDSLIVKSTATDFGWGFRLTNGADHNVIKRCTIDLTSVTSTLLSNSTGIVMTGSPTSAISAGQNGSHNLFEHNTILGSPGGGPGYGISLYGETSGNSHSNTIRFNTVLNSYGDAIRVSNQPNCTIEDNYISRPNKTASSTFYGIWALGTAGVNENLVIKNNRIVNVAGNLPATNTIAFYGIYVSSAGSANNPRALIANNIVHLAGTSGTYYGVWFVQPHINVVHNTIYLESANSTTALTRGLFNGATVLNSTEYWIRNNLVYIDRDGSSAKHCIYLSNSAGSNVIIDNNAYFIINPPTNSGVGSIGTANFPTLANWQTADNGAYDQNSIFVDPMFVNPAQLNFEPSATMLNGAGGNLGGLVPTDINGMIRPTFPVPGAIQFSPPPGPDPGIQSFLQPAMPLCDTVAPVEVRIVNFGVDSVTSLSVRLKINNTVIDTIHWTGLLPSAGFLDLTLGTFSIVPNQLYTIEAKIIASGPGNDIDVANNTLEITGIRSGLQGTYTINDLAAASATNFQSFTDLANAFQDIGICGPVTVNVVPLTGPYIEQVEFGAIQGSSAINTVTIHGNGNVIQFAPNTNSRHIIRLTGTKHLTIDSLSILSTSTDFGWGVWLDNNSDSNTIRNCTIDLSAVTSTLLSNSVGIVMTGSPTSAISASQTGSYNLFEKNTIVGSPSGGPGYGMSLYGVSTGDVGSNVIRDNVILNTHGDAIRVSNMPNTVIEGNYISRPDRTATTTFYGIWALGSAGVNENLIIRNNTIVNVGGDVPSTNTAGFYGIYVTSAGTALQPRALIANNIISLSGTNGLYRGIWISQPYINILHNTIHIEEPNSTTGLTQGIYSSATSANASNVWIKNNIVYVDRAGSSAKYCLEVLNNPVDYEINHNAYFITSGNVVRFVSTDHQTLSSWQQSNNNAFDQNSVFANPSFADPADEDFTPQSGAVNDLGANLTSLVPTDNNGVTRSATPDPGAIEFVPLPCSGAWAFNIDSLYPQGVFLSWESMKDTFEIDWGPVGFLPGSPTGTTVTGIGAKTYQLPLPNVNTCYHIYVREKCDSVSFGPYTGPLLVCTPIEFDADLLEVLGVSNQFCGDSNTVLQLVVRNNGFDTITSLPYTVALAGDINQTFSATYTIPILSGETDTILVGTVNTYQGVNVQMNAYVSLPNDQDNDNDTINLSMTIIPFEPMADSTLACPGDTSATLVAKSITGVGYKWYDAPTGGTLLGTGDSLVINNLTATYYLEYQQVADSMLTSNQGGSGCTHGNMFDLISPTGVSITGFTLVPLSTATNHQVTIWTKSGSWQGSTQANWTQIFTTTIPSVTIDVPFKVDLPSPIILPPNQTVGFYVQHNARYSVGSTTVSTPDLTFISGNGHCSAFDYCCDPRIFNGIIHYGKEACSDTRTPVNVSIIDTPTVAFTYSITNYTVSFNATVTDADSVFWTFGTAGSSSQLNPTFTFPQNGVYPVCLTAFNQCGTATKCDTLTFSIGINELSLQSRLKVYPNPNAGVFEVTFSDDVAELPVELLDLAGKTVYRDTWRSAGGAYTERINVQTLPAGTYMLRIHSSAGMITRKVVVNK